MLAAGGVLRDRSNMTRAQVRRRVGRHERAKHSSTACAEGRLAQQLAARAGVLRPAAGEHEDDARRVPRRLAA